MNMLAASRSIVRTMSGGTTIQPIRQPVMLKYLEKLLMTTTSSVTSSALTQCSP